MSSNYFDCSQANFSEMGNVTDYLVWKQQCVFSCLPFTLPNVSYPQTTSRWATGVCQPGFVGSPTLECLRSGVGRSWARASNGTCTVVSASAQLAAAPGYMALPVLLFVFTLVLKLISLCLPESAGVIFLCFGFLSNLSCAALQTSGSLPNDAFLCLAPARLSGHGGFLVSRRCSP